MIGVKEDDMIDQLEFIIFLLGEPIQTKPITMKSYVSLICSFLFSLATMI